MISSFIVKTILFGALLLFLFALFFIWLTRRKSSEDKNAFSQVLKTDSVTTFYKPEEFARAARDRGKTESE